MGADTGIQWTDATWNPVRGCSRISPGCERCYAETMAARFGGAGQWAEGFALRSPARWTRKVELVPELLDLPLRWKKGRKIFVNSMSDLFHESLSNEAIAAVFGVMAAAPQHTFQILTKRAERLPEWFAWMAETGPSRHTLGAARGVRWYAWGRLPEGRYPAPSYPASAPPSWPWPLPNVWLGVSVEDQQRADERIPPLLRASAAVRFLSVEPLLGPVDLSSYLRGSVGKRVECATCHLNKKPRARSAALAMANGLCDGDCPGYDADPQVGDLWPGERRRDFGYGPPVIDWVIVGGESGAGARPMRLEWAYELVSQCTAASVPVFVKQIGARPTVDPASAGFSPPQGEAWEPVPLKLHDRKGGDPSEWPADLCVREFPTTREEE